MKKGRLEERRLVELAEQHGVTMIGPNCVGIVTPHYCGKFAGIVPKLKKGSVDVISASGATVDYLMEQAEVRGLKFDNVITLGNSAHYGVEDVIELLDETHSSEHAPVKFIYIETDQEAPEAVETCQKPDEERMCPGRDQIRSDG